MKSVNISPKKDLIISSTLLNVKKKIKKTLHLFILFEIDLNELYLNIPSFFYWAILILLWFAV